MQFVHYYVLPDLPQHAASYVSHLGSRQFLGNASGESDLFGRVPGFLNWDSRPAGGGWDARGVHKGRILQVAQLC